METIGIIGAGPAGLMAAHRGASKGNKIIIFEKNNKIGKKLFITGKGRCNITNATDIENFFENIISNPYFLYSSFYTFTNRDLIELLNKFGLSTKVERGNRVFPNSDKSSDVLKVFEKLLMRDNISLKLNTEVKSVNYLDNIFIVTTDKGHKYQVNKLLISTGGMSYPTTGSSGDGYRFAKTLGHTITDISPCLVPIEVKEKWLLELQGLSLKNVNLKTFNKDKLIHEEFGEMIFTHYGISGPIVLTTSNFVKDRDNNIKFKLDLKPGLSMEKLDKRILRDFNENNNKELKNGLKDLLPQKLIPLIINRSNISPSKTIHQITKEERLSLLYNIKNLAFSMKKLRPIEEAIVTGGGINIKEIDSSTMESKLLPGLYFAGETIDVHGLTGGFNLQIAFSTGYLAGLNL